MNALSIIHQHNIMFTTMSFYNKSFYRKSNNVRVNHKANSLEINLIKYLFQCIHKLYRTWIKRVHFRMKNYNLKNCEQIHREIDICSSHVFYKKCVSPNHSFTLQCLHYSWHISFSDIYFTKIYGISSRRQLLILTFGCTTDIHQHIKSWN